MQCAKPECRCYALTDDECCYFHTTRPEVVERRKRAQRRGGSKNKLPTDDIQEFIKLRARGLSFDKISKQINVSKPTLIRWSRKFSAEIAAQKVQLDKERQQRYETWVAAMIEERARQVKEIMEGRS